MNYSAFLASTTLAQADSSTPTAKPAATTGADAGAGTTQQTAPPGGGMINILMFGALGVFVVMMILSSRKQKKKAAEMMARLQKGAKVTTIGGARGKVVDLTDTEVTLQFEDCRITFLRSAVQSIDEVPA